MLLEALATAQGRERWLVVGFTKGMFDFRGAQKHLVEFISALSATLQTVTFKSYSLFLDQIRGAVHPNLKQLCLRSCKIRPSSLGTPLSADLGLRTSSYNLGALVSSMTEIAQLPVKFRGLNVEYFQTQDMSCSTNTLIKSNAGWL